MRLVVGVVVICGGSGLEVSRSGGVHEILSERAWSRIRRGAVHVEHGFISDELCGALRADATSLHARERFRGDGLYKLGKAREQQGFDVKADRQTYTDGWESSEGDLASRRVLADRLNALRVEASARLERETMGQTGDADERTYNWYEPNASLRRHADEHHEETKGPKGWALPTRRSLTWLLYLNDSWQTDEGGALRCYERRDGDALADVGASRDGDLQVGWLRQGAREAPVYLGEDPRGGHVLYDAQGPLSAPVATLPREQDLGVLVVLDERPNFAVIRGALGDAEAPPPRERPRDIYPTAGTLVLFDSVAVPHEVLPVTSDRARIAATGWFHERLPDPLLS